jgi:hypothetical protein
MRADGSTFPVELTVTRLGGLDGSAPMFAGFVRDITERRRSREELTRLLEREHETARTLQRAPLPERLPGIPVTSWPSATWRAPREVSRAATGTTPSRCPTAASAS